MSDDVSNSDVANQLHYDLHVKRLTESNSTGFSNDLEKSERGRDAENRLKGEFFYKLVGRRDVSAGNGVWLE